MTTTVEKVKNIASHLKDVPDSIIQLYIDDAVEEVNDLGATKNREKLQRYLAAHFATLNERRVTSYSVDDINVSYQALQGENLDSTEYGQEFKRLLKRSRKFFIKVL